MLQHYFQSNVLVHLIYAIKLLEVARSLSRGKAQGPDGLYNEVLKVAFIGQPTSFLQTYNACLTNAMFPNRWKTGRLVLIPKPEQSVYYPTAYRLLCMLDTTAKLFEKLLVRRLRSYLSDNNLLANNQYGFRNGHSILQAIDRSVVKATNSKGYLYNPVVEMLTLNVDNAFNNTTMRFCQQKGEYWFRNISLIYLDCTSTIEK